MTGITRPTGDQLRFNSSATGSHILDDYLEAAERGTKTLGELVDTLFDLNGDLAVFKYRGAWSAATAYAVYDIVLQGGDLYVCHTAHTSGGSFSGTAQWVLATTAGQIDAAAVVLQDRLTATSVSPVTIGLGAKNLTIQTGEAFTPGQLIRVASSPTAWMVGAVTSYDAVTGDLVVNVTSFAGTGTLSIWAITITGETGAAGTVAVGTAGGTANALEISPTPGIPSHTGRVFSFVAAADNTGGATIAVSGLAPVAILQPNGTALTPNTLRAGHAYTVAFDGAAYRLQSAGSATPDFLLLANGAF